MIPPQLIVIKLHIEEMHFKNVYRWVHTLYKKILNTFTSSTDCTSLLRHLCHPNRDLDIQSQPVPQPQAQPPIPVSVCEELLLELTTTHSSTS